MIVKSKHHHGERHKSLIRIEDLIAKLREGEEMETSQPTASWRDVPYLRSLEKSERILLRKTIGSAMWLDSLTNGEFGMIRDEIVSVFLKEQERRVT